MKLVNTPHKLLLCIVRLDVNMNVLLAETLLKYFGNVQA